MGETSVFSGKYTHNRNNFPSSLYVQYDCDSEVLFDSEFSEFNIDQLNEYLEELNDISKSMDDELNGLTEQEQSEYQDNLSAFFEENGLSGGEDPVSVSKNDDGTVVYTDNNTSASSKSKTWTDEAATAEALIASGFEKIKTYSEESELYSKYTDNGIIVANLTTHTFISIQYDEAAINTNNGKDKEATGEADNKEKLQGSLLAVGTLADKIQPIVKSIYDTKNAILTKANQIVVQFERVNMTDQGLFYYDSITKTYNASKGTVEMYLKAANILKRVCQIVAALQVLIDGYTFVDYYSKLVNAYNKYCDLESEYSKYKCVTDYEYETQMYNRLLSMSENMRFYGASLLSSLTSLALSLSGISTLDPIMIAAGAVNTLASLLLFEYVTYADTENHAQVDLQEALMLYNAGMNYLSKLDCKEEPTTEPDTQSPTSHTEPASGGSGDSGGSGGSGGNSSGGDVRGILDPSGFVYAAVESNRLEGVKVTAYYSENADGSNAEIWDAEDFDQQNPLFTDILGQYEWYVPDGYWQVKYEKDGYETAESKPMPVPTQTPSTWPLALTALSTACQASCATGP